MGQVTPQTIADAVGVSRKGRLAVRTLLRRLEAQDDSPVEHHVLPTELVVRDSTGPVPA